MVKEEDKIDGLYMLLKPKVKTLLSRIKAKLIKKPVSLIRTTSNEMHTFWDVRVSSMYVNPRNLPLKIRFINYLRVCLERYVSYNVLKISLSNSPADKAKAELGQFKVLCFDEDNVYKNSAYFERMYAESGFTPQADISLESRSEFSSQDLVEDELARVSPSSNKPSDVYEEIKEKAFSSRPAPGSTIYAEDVDQFKSIVGQLKEQGFTSAVQDDELDRRS